MSVSDTHAYKLRESLLGLAAGMVQVKSEDINYMEVTRRQLTVTHQTDIGTVTIRIDFDLAAMHEEAQS